MSSAELLLKGQKSPAVSLGQTSTDGEGFSLCTRTHRPEGTAELRSATTDTASKSPLDKEHLKRLPLRVLVASNILPSTLDTLDSNCYRPRSILPCLSKVFESQVNKQITDHF